MLLKQQLMDLMQLILSIAAKEEEIKAAQTEKEALETICKKNESVLAKLTAILE